MSIKTRIIMFVVLAAMLITPFVQADGWDQKTTFTFGEPVAVPGQVLPAGTYVFRLANSSSDRHIVQIFDERQTRIYGTFLAIPDYHMNPPSEPLVKFHERPAGEPQAIRAWVYPGRTYGHEFVYPKNKAVQLAQLNHVPVPAMPTELTPDAVKPDVKIDAPEVREMVAAPLTAEEPSGQEVALETAFPPAPDPVNSGDSETELPATASALPLIAGLGMLSLAAAGTLRVAAAAKKQISK